MDVLRGLILRIELGLLFHLWHVGVREVLDQAIGLVLKDLVVLLARLSWFALLDDRHVEQSRVK